MRIGGENLARELKGRDRLFPGHGREFVQKYFEAVTSFKVVEQDLDRDASSNKHGRASEDLWITVDNQL
jgi:hypothetical protein